MQTCVGGGAEVRFLGHTTSDVHLSHPGENPNLQALEEVHPTVLSVLSAAIDGKESRMVEEVISCMRGNLTDEEVRCIVQGVGGFRSRGGLGQIFCGEVGVTEYVYVLVRDLI